MKVLHVPHAYAPVLGGAELLCKRVSEELAGLGHRVRVVTSDVGSVDGYYKYGVSPVRNRPVEMNGVEVVTVPYGGALYEPVGRWIAATGPGKLADRLGGRLLRIIHGRFRAALMREIRAFRPDVVMTMPHLVTNVVAVLEIRKEMPFPLVLLPLLHETQIGFWRESIGDALQEVDAAIALTEHEALQLQSVCGFAAEAVFNAGAGVDLPHGPSKTPRTDSVVCLGRKDPGKGIPELLQAMKLVWEKHPRVSVVLAGARTSGNRVIDGLIAELPAAQRSMVRSMDDISEQEKFELLAGARCLVLPSRMESFGLVLLEAWACGAPVVTYDLPVFRCTVDDGENGLLVEPGSARSLAAAILRLIEDPALADRLGGAGREKVRKQYRWRSVAERFLAAYEFAVKARGLKSGADA